MSPRRHTAIRLEDELLDAMRFLAERDGVPVAEQVRRGVKLWLESKGMQPKAKSAVRRKPKSS